MKKNNNKFRSSSNNNSYSLNYRFDSVSPAGKINGTALDLIKRYNELAKEAHSSGDYIEMEVYRQYAEHYRKIVTEINERKAARVENVVVENSTIENVPTETINNNHDTNTNIETVVDDNAQITATPEEKTKLSLNKKTFKIVEVSENQENLLQETPAVVTDKPKRVVRRKSTPVKADAIKTVEAV